MLVKFDTLANNSRLWIFQSSHSEFTQMQCHNITLDLERFVSSWQAHYNDIIAGVKILFSRFIIVAANESTQEVTGCSIDTLINFMKELEKKYNLNLFDRMILAYKINNEIKTCPSSQIKKTIQDNTIIFDNTIRYKSDLESKWQVKAKNSWCKNFYK